MNGPPSPKTAPFPFSLHTEYRPGRFYECCFSEQNRARFDIRNFTFLYFPFVKVRKSLHDAHVDFSLLLQRENTKKWNFWYQILPDFDPRNRSCRTYQDGTLCATKTEMEQFWVRPLHSTTKLGNQSAYAGVRKFWILDPTKTKVAP